MAVVGGIAVVGFGTAVVGGIAVVGLGSAVVGWMTITVGTKIVGAGVAVMMITAAVGGGSVGSASGVKVGGGVGVIVGLSVGVPVGSGEAIRAAKVAVTLVGEPTSPTACGVSVGVVFSDETRLLKNPMISASVTTPTSPAPQNTSSPATPPRLRLGGGGSGIPVGSMDGSGCGVCTYTESCSGGGTVPCV